MNIKITKKLSRQNLALSTNISLFVREPHTLTGTTTVPQDRDAILLQQQIKSSYNNKFFNAKFDPKSTYCANHII